LWWIYRSYTQEEQDKINEFLNYFKVELGPMMNGNLHDNMELLAKHLGVFPHPSFAKPKVEL
jgi:hypothetical protein